MRIWFLVVCLVAIQPARGQDPVRIDPGHGDTSPNAISLRKLDLDLRQPSGFQNIYQISRIDAFGTRENTFMRIDGAVAAVFPRSVYVPAPGGLLPDIPPGTVFYIGGVPNMASPERHYASTFLNLSAASMPDPQQPPPVVSITSMFTDERYRHHRLEALMSYALDR